MGLECLVEFPDCNLYFRAPAVLCSALFRDGESSNTSGAKRRRTSAVHQPAVVRQKFSTATTIVRFSRRVKQRLRIAV